MSRYVKLTNNFIVDVRNFIKDDEGNYFNPEDLYDEEIHSWHIEKESDTIEELIDYWAIEDKSGELHTFKNGKDVLDDLLIQDKFSDCEFFGAIYCKGYGLIYVVDVDTTLNGRLKLREHKGDGFDFYD